MRRDKSDAAACASSCETLASSLLALSLLLCCLTSVFVFVTTWAKAEEEVALKLAFVSPALFFHFFSLFPPFHLLHFPQRALLPPITLPHSHFQSSSLLSFTFVWERAALFAFFFCGWGRGSCCCCSCCFCCCVCRCCICCCCCLILFNWVWICETKRVTEYEWERVSNLLHILWRGYWITYLSQLLIMCSDDSLLLAE